MSEFVIDASALAFALIGKGPEAAAVRSRLAAAECHAPHLIDAEVGNVLRKRVRAADITDREARTAFVTGREVIDYRYAHFGVLSDMAWALRDNLSFYDALYVALATRLGVRLMTSDRRLGRAAGMQCPIELI